MDANIEEDPILALARHHVNSALLRQTSRMQNTMDTLQKQVLEKHSVSTSLLAELLDRGAVAMYANALAVAQNTIEALMQELVGKDADEAVLVEHTGNWRQSLADLDRQVIK